MTDCVVYIIRSKDRLRAYVGLTSNPVQRLLYHHSSGSDAVNTLLCASHSVTISRPLAASRAAILERVLIDRLRGQGVKMANKAPGGAGGWAGVSTTKELIIEKATQYRTVEAFKKAMAASYRLAQQHGWLRDVGKAITAANRAERKSGQRKLDGFGRKWKSKRQLKPAECRKKTGAQPQIKNIFEDVAKPPLSRP